MKRLAIGLGTFAIIMCQQAVAQRGGQECRPTWSPLGAGVNSVTRAMLLWDHDQSAGTPAALVLGGFFSAAGGQPAARIAMWNGQTWSTFGLGFNSQVSALVEFDADGSGGPNAPALHAGGFFTSSGGAPMLHVARWNGTVWEQVGDGIGMFNDETVTSLAVYDLDGSGPAEPALIAGGFFTNAGGAPAENLAYYDGSVWRELHSGSNGTITMIKVLDLDLQGPMQPVLIVGGAFSVIGSTPCNNIAMYNNATGTWSALGSGVNASVDDAVVFDEDGAGPNPPELVVGGNFVQAGGGQPVNYIARWNAGTQQWSAIGALNAPAGFNSNVLALSVMDEDGPGPLRPALFAGGNFSMTAAGHVVEQIARWNGENWSSVGGGTDSQVSRMIVFDHDGGGAAAPALIIGGFFGQAGQQPISRVAAWHACPARIGDTNADGVVGVGDLLAVLNAWGACPAFPAICPGDVAQPPDHVVNVSDLLAVIANWG